MRENLLAGVTGTEISVIKDPFKKACVGNIWMHYNTFLQEGYWEGWVEFKNGNTQGKQATPRCKTFEELVAAMRQILDFIEQKENE